MKNGRLINEYEIGLDIDRRIAALLDNFESDPIHKSLTAIASRFVGLGNDNKSFCECQDCDVEECDPS